MNKYIVPVATLISLALAGTAQAITVTGASSDTSKVIVGESNVNGGPHTSGHAGFDVTSISSTYLIDFQGLTSYSTATGTSPVAYTLDYSTAAPDDHSNMGHFNFAQVGTSDIWFGEWSQTTSASDGTHTVYYSGDATGTTVPTTGSATYTVAGLSNYNVNGILAGTFTANFSSGTLSGGLSNSASTYAINATIDASTASFSGTANVLAGTTVAAGTTTGNFYGANAASLAGIASFGSHSVYDVAFGGTKQ